MRAKRGLEFPPPTHTLYSSHQTVGGKNLFYSDRYNFLNLEKRKYFILEEDYKLRAAMYDVDPTDPR